MYNESMVIVMSMQTAAPAEFFQRLPVPWWGRSRPGNTRWSSGQTRCRTRRTEEIQEDDLTWSGLDKREVKRMLARGSECGGQLGGCD